MTKELGSDHRAAGRQKTSPVADIAYSGVATGIKAGNDRLAAANKAEGSDEIPILFDIDLKAYRPKA
ncbi:hypothetical protein [Phaeobacter sp. B1627]|uniref:hypothetical protein n=1 Tax=Phaeobacter sp. B1627 TaxID=2583809 RepID=UPI00111AC43E|nr:hypothetical protein [Phaeobacter sp. B1627]TNJ44448.1 hypothetical protein FGE21_07870 [Phaeobacter sp. B1627]